MPDFIHQALIEIEHLKEYRRGKTGRLSTHSISYNRGLSAAQEVLMNLGVNTDDLLYHQLNQELAQQMDGWGYKLKHRVNLTN
jgi:hypothetical protein